MAGVELGTGYVNIVASAKGIDSSIKGELGGIETAAGKTGGAIGSMQAKAMAGIAAAGVAIAGFAASGIKEYQNLGVEVGKFADATGLSAEQSSRMIEVAGDLGIESSTLEGVINKMNKTAGATPEAFADLGIEIAHTKDGAVDANQTFLNTVDRLNAIKDPAERAEAGTKLLGRGWTSTAELVGLGSAKITKELDAVADNKVLTDEDVGQARGLRGAFDKIGDAVDELQLALGKKLAPAVIEGADLLVEMIDAAGPLIDLLGKGLTAAFKALKPAIEDVGEKIKAVADFIPKLVQGVKDFTDVDLGGVFGDILDVVNPVDNTLHGFKRTLDDNAGAGEKLFGVVEGLIGPIPILGEGFQRLGDAIWPTVTGIVKAGEGLADYTAAQEAASEAVTFADLKVEEYNASIVSFYEKQYEANTASREEAEALGIVKAELAASQNAAQLARDEQNRLADAAGRVEEKVRAQAAEWNALLAPLDNTVAFNNLATQFDGLVIKIGETAAAMEAGTTTQEQGMRDVSNEIIATKKEVIAYTEQIGGIPASIATEYLTMIDEGKYDEVQRRLEILARNRTMELSIVAKGGIGFALPGSGGKLATGGPVRAGGMYEVDEGGRSELLHTRSGTFLMAGSDGYVSPMSGFDMQGAGGRPVVVQVDMRGYIDRRMAVELREVLYGLELELN